MTESGINARPNDRLACVIILLTIFILNGGGENEGRVIITIYGKLFKCCVLV